MFGRRKQPIQAAPAVTAEPIIIFLLPHSGGFDGDGGEHVEIEGCDAALDAEGSDPLYVDEARARLFHCRVNGVTRHERDLQLPAFALGSKVVLEPEPTNPVDPNAIRVLSADFKHVIGYVPKDLAGELVPLFARGAPSQGIVIKVFTKHGRRVAVRIVGAVGQSITVRSV